MVLISTFKTKHLKTYVRIDILDSNVRKIKSELRKNGEKKMKKINKKKQMSKLEKTKDEYFRKSATGYYLNF